MFYCVLHYVLQVMCKLAKAMISHPYFSAAAAAATTAVLLSFFICAFSFNLVVELTTSVSAPSCFGSTVLSDARPSSLVLVDELGKGTEVVSGTAIAGSILRSLATKGAM